jgi:hypothetical protein
MSVLKGLPWVHAHDQSCQASATVHMNSIAALYSTLFDTTMQHAEQPLLAALLACNVAWHDRNTNKKVSRLALRRAVLRRAGGLSAPSGLLVPCRAV